MKTRRGFKLVLTVFFCGFALKSEAQKLPAIQTASVRAPANIKIDGKATEWYGKFQAYNKNAKVYYSITNDDENIYLAIQAKDDATGKKIVSGGITFAVSAPGHKTGKNDPLVTYPQYGMMDNPRFIAANQLTLASHDDTVKNKTYLDSLARARNGQVGSWAKAIGVAHLQGITESEVSLYNDDGIKAALRFESDLSCLYELAIPLKYLRLNIGDGVKFSYQIKLNGVAVNGTNIRDLREGRYFAWDRADGTSFTVKMDADQVFPTDFGGEYTLAKKQ